MKSTKQNLATITHFWINNSTHKTEIDALLTHVVKPNNPVN